MPNPIKYSTGDETLAIRSGNFYIGTGDVPKGPTASTGYYNGISPPSGGYTIYLNKASDGPSIYVAANNSGVIDLTNIISGQNYTTIEQALTYYVGQNDKMVTNVDYPAITTDGLVLDFDSGFVPSYPKTGTTFYDVSLSVLNGVVANGPVYNSNNDGYLAFDGTDDYVDFTASSLNTVATIEIWGKLGASFAGNMFYGWLQYDVWCNGGNIGFNTGNSDLYGIPSATVTSLGCVGNWKHYVFEMYSNVSYTNNKIYVNASSQSLSQIQGSENAALRNFNSGVGRFSGWRLGTSYHIPMDLGSFRIYNRSLTQEEITQNFNTTKSRFGVT